MANTDKQKMTLERAAEILDPTHREHYESIDPVNEARKIGRKAILKQIPQPLKFWSNNYNRDGSVNDSIVRCPSCGTGYLKRSLWDYSYCPNCGQALDWRKNNE